MNKAIAVLVLALASSPVMADTPLCETMENMAQAMMGARQRGMPMSRSMEIADSSPIQRQTVRAMVVEAYRHPRYNTPSIRQRTIVEFGNEAYAACLQYGPV